MNTARGSSGTAQIVALGEERTRRAALGEAAPSLDTAGAMLRAAREDAGYTREEVAAEINVRSERLEAIETMTLGALPSAPYTLGFVRAYADFLALPVEPLVARFREEAGWVRNATAPFVAPPPKQSREREIGLFGVVVVALFIIWAVWQIVGNTPDSGANAELPSGFPIADRTSSTEVVPEVTTSLEDDLATAPPLAVPDAAPSAGKATPVSTETAEDVALPASGSVNPNTAPRFALVPTVLISPLKTAPAPAETTAADRQPTPFAAPSRADALNERLLREVMADSEPAVATRPSPRETTPTAQTPNPRGVTATAAPATSVAPSESPRVSERVAAVLTSPVSPVYPRRCRSRAADEEVVLVRFGVSRFGRVTGPAIDSSTNGCFDDAALSAVSRFGFDPATEGGRAVATSGRTTRIVFRKP